MKFKDLVIPKKLEADEKTLNGSYGKFYAEPFESGYGHTIGNSLRRILLSSLEGAAMTRLKIKGVAHEFSVLPGVVEDVMAIILNLKKVRYKSFSEELKVIHLKVKGEKDITANDIAVDSNIEIMNKNLHIAHLEPNGELDIEITIEKGRGYLSSESQDKASVPIDTIAVDALFTPVLRVNYEVENARVGHITDYDRLVIEIWTDGTLKPDDALAYSAKVLKDSMNIFINFEETTTIVGTSIEKTVEEKEEEYDEKIRQMLQQSVDIIELSVRSSNCLRNAKIKLIKELVKKKEEDLLNYKNFGRKSLDEIKAKLQDMGLSLGMDIKNLTK
ncbi:DNA-directed RNA polymerase subunit alpha [bacterium]